MKQNIAQIISNQISNIDIRHEPKQYCFDVMEVLCRNLGFYFGAILLADGEGNGSIFSFYNLPALYPEWGVGVGTPILSGPSGDAIRNKEIVWVENIATDARLTPWYPLLLRFEIETIVWVPLFKGKEAFGTYILFDRVKREPTHDELDILGFLGVLFSIVILNNEYIDEIKAKSEKLEREITERKRAETELRMAKYLSDAANRARNEFLSNMSHEIRTPMNAILGFADILLEEETDPSKLEALEIIHGAGENLMSLINDILDLAKIESGRMEPDNINFSLAKLMEHLDRMFRAEAEQKGLQFLVTTAPELTHMVNGDRYKISKIVVSILKNAFKFTRKGQIAVHCSYDFLTHEGVIAVSDTGIGIPEEKQHLIFKAFKQGDGSTTRHFGGTGLGLTIAVKLAQVLGGHIGLESREGIGTTFTVRLPLPIVESR